MAVLSGLMLRTCCKYVPVIAGLPHMNSRMAHVEANGQVPSLPHSSSEQLPCHCLAIGCSAGRPLDFWRYYCGFQGARA